jgi:esterase
MGGKVAMRLALDFPSRVEKLVVADIAPRIYVPEHEVYFSALLALDLKTLRSRQQMEEALAPAIPNLAVRRFLLKNLGLKPDGSYFWKINLECIHKNYPHICEALPPSKPFLKPALFINGRKSDYVSEADHPLILNLFPNAQFQTLAGASHWIHADAPEEFAHAVANFFNHGERGLNHSPNQRNL